MRPASGSVVYRPDLGVAVMEYYEDPTVMGYIGLEIMPLFYSGVQASVYPIIPKEELMNVPDVSRAPRGKYNRGDWNYENGKFSTAEKGWEEPIDDGERKILETRVPGLADFVATKRAMGHILRSQEKRIADKIFNSSNFTAHAVTTEWNTSATAKPLTDVKDAKAAFRLQCGMLPDALVINYTTFQDMKSCAEVIDRIKYTFPGTDIEKMNTQQLAAILDIPRVLVGGSVYNSAKKNKAASITELWSYEYAALVKISAGDDITQPGVGRTFLFTEDSPENAVVESYRDDTVRSDVFRVRHHVDEAFMKSYTDTGTVQSDIAAACVYLMSNIHT